MTSEQFEALIEWVEAKAKLVVEEALNRADCSDSIWEYEAREALESLLLDADSAETD